MNKLVLSFVLLLFLNCTSKKEGDGELSAYYHEYIIALGETNTQVQIVANFLKGHEYGKPQALPEGYSVYMDNKQIALDKEVYPSYSTEWKREGFNGKHTWTVKNKDKAELEIPFSFSTFIITGGLESELGKSDVPMTIAGLAEGATIECWFDNLDLDNETDRFLYTVTNNTFTIPLKDIKSLKQGVYKLRIAYVERKPVMYNGREAGKLDVSYILTDKPVTIKY